jgi:hypothetical protein
MICWVGNETWSDQAPSGVAASDATVAQHAARGSLQFSGNVPAALSDLSCNGG